MQALDLSVFVPLCVSALGVDMISQLPRVRSEGLGVQAVQGRAGISGETSEAVGLDHLSLLLGKQKQAQARGPLGQGGCGPACLLLTTLPPAVLPGLRGPHRPEGRVCAGPIFRPFV